jgi:hypothetical protein
MPPPVAADRSAAKAGWRRLASRAVAEAVLQFLTKYDVEGLTGVGHYERDDSRQTWRNGYRDRELKTRLGTLKLRQDTDCPGFLEPRRRMGVSRRADPWVDASGLKLPQGERPFWPRTVSQTSLSSSQSSTARLAHRDKRFQTLFQRPNFYGSARHVVACTAKKRSASRNSRSSRPFGPGGRQAGISAPPAPNPLRSSSWISPAFPRSFLHQSENLPQIVA